MNIALLAASPVGRKTRGGIDKAAEFIKEQEPNATVTIIDVKDLTIDFSDGRNYLDYKNDTLLVTQTLMAADIIVIGTPTFQASIPGSLKNIFDLLPQKAFFRKTVALLVTAGSAKHYLMAENQLKPILNYMKANLLPNYVFAEDRDFNGAEIVNQDVLYRLETLMEDTLILAKTYEKLWQEQEDQYDF